MKKAVRILFRNSLDGSSGGFSYPHAPWNVCESMRTYMLLSSLSLPFSRSLALQVIRSRSTSVSICAHSLEMSTSVSSSRSPLQMYLYLPRVYYFTISKLFRSAFYPFPQQSAKLTLLSLAYTHTAVLRQSYFPCWLCENVCTCLYAVSLFLLSLFLSPSLSYTYKTYVHTNAISPAVCVNMFVHVSLKPLAVLPNTPKPFHILSENIPGMKMPPGDAMKMPGDADIAQTLNSPRIAALRP